MEELGWELVGERGVLDFPTLHRAAWASSFNTEPLCPVWKTEVEKRGNVVGLKTGA